MLVVLDDDPTGTQLVRDVPVALQLERATIAAAIADGDGVVHVLTNARAHPPPRGVRARALHCAALAALDLAPGAQLVARGDSTLRGHGWEEYQAIRDASAPPSGVGHRMDFAPGTRTCCKRAGSSMPDTMGSPS